MTVPEKKDDDHKKDGHGDKSPGKSGFNVPKAWGIAILVVVLVFSGLIPMLAEQLGFLFMTMKMHGGAILGIVAAFFLWRFIKK